MHLFLTYTILGLVTGAVYGIAASGLVLTYTTSGIFNFAQGAMAMLAALHLLAAPLRVELARPAGAVRGDRRAGAPARRGALRGHHAGAARDGRRHQDRGHHRNHARAHRAGPVDLEPRSTPDRRSLLRECGEVQGARRLRHRPRGHRARLRGDHRGGHPPALHEHPHRRRHAGRGRQSGPAPAQRRTPGSPGRLLVGTRRRARPPWPASSSPRSAAAPSTSTC